MTYTMFPLHAPTFVPFGSFPFLILSLLHTFFVPIWLLLSQIYAYVHKPTIFPSTYKLPPPRASLFLKNRNHPHVNTTPTMVLLFSSCIVLDLSDIFSLLCPLSLLFHVLAASFSPYTVILNHLRYSPSLAAVGRRKYIVLLISSTCRYAVLIFSILFVLLSLPTPSASQVHMLAHP